MKTRGVAYLRVRLIHQCLRQCSQNCPSKRSCYEPASSLIALRWVQHMDSHLLQILLKALIITKVMSFTQCHTCFSCTVINRGVLLLALKSMQESLGEFKATLDNGIF